LILAQALVFAAKMTAIELIHTRELAGAAITEAGGLGADVGVVQLDFNF
jgi:hypothetical protein